MLRRRVLTGEALGFAGLLDWLGTDPGVRANMVASVDGRVAIGGRVGALTSAADQQLLVALRGWCDVLLVGAGTIRAEGYGAVRLPDEVVAIRTRRGQSPRPVLAILVGRDGIDPDLPALSEANRDNVPWVITALGRGLGALGPHVRVLEVASDDQGRPSVQAALEALRSAGLGRILSEGGPTVLGPMLPLVDELFVTVSPMVVGGEGLRVVHGPEYPGPVSLTLVDVLGAGDEVFLRYAVGLDGTTT